jgi:hypothetical protein
MEIEEKANRTHKDRHHLAVIADPERIDETPVNVMQLKQPEQ